MSKSTKNERVSKGEIYEALKLMRFYAYCASCEMDCGLIRTCSKKKHMEMADNFIKRIRKGGLR